MSITVLPLACATCQTTMRYGGGEAASWSIFFLLAVILAVLGGVIFCMIRISRRERENFDPELADDDVSAAPAR
jgi:hypothetical protein